MLSLGLLNAQVVDERWSQPFQLSSTDGQASEARMVTDQDGYTHVLWSEWGLSENRAIIQ